MSEALIHDRLHWLQRAAEMRMLATTIVGDEAREVLLRIATHYDHLANQAEEHRNPYGKSAPNKLAGRAVQPSAPAIPAATPINPFGSQVSQQPVPVKA